MGMHGQIEFGNRLLGVALELVGVGLLAAVLRLRAAVPRSWRWLALVQSLVVPVQAVVGGILVLTNLNPWVRALHFMVSFLITWAAVALLRRVLDGPGPRSRLVASELRVLTGTVLGVAAAVVVAGTLVSATGPHAGDPGAERLPLDPLQVTQAHADLVWLLIGLTIGAALAARVARAPLRVRAGLTALLILIAAQGALGYAQYYTGVPELLVALHMLGASLLFSTAAWTHASTTGPSTSAPRPIPVSRDLAKQAALRR